METAANASRQQAALSDVPDATAVITNPTHFAVALKYEVGSSEAPRILAMGRGKMAHQIIDRLKGFECDDVSFATSRTCFIFHRRNWF